MPALDEVDLDPELRMKRMRDPHRRGHITGAERS